jgi:hypothetical protein
MAALTVYSVDSSAFIHGWHRIYRPKNFGFVWDRLGVLIEEGRLKASIEVYNDLGKKDDELFKWCKERKNKLVVDIDAATQAQVARIMAVYPRLVDTVSGRSGSDPFVIALAATANPIMTVVTEEHSGESADSRCLQRRENRFLRPCRPYRARELAVLVARCCGGKLVLVRRPLRPFHHRPRAVSRPPGESRARSVS